MNMATRYKFTAKMQNNAIDSTM